MIVEIGVDVMFPSITGYGQIIILCEPHCSWRHVTSSGSE